MIESKKQNKFCIFCGNEPQNKNKEHLIPKWLIKRTISNEILANIKFDNSNNSFKPLYMNINSFVFQSCKACNDEFANLEKEAMQIIEKFLNFELNFSLEEVNYLLDWFDKLRIGLSLANFFINPEFLTTIPIHNIKNRSGKKDRILGFFYLDEMIPGLNFFCHNSPIFMNTPSWIGFRFLNLIFIYGSYDFLTSPIIGFPHPLQWNLIDGSKKFYSNKYTNRPMKDTDYWKKYFPYATWIGQSIQSDVDPSTFKALSERILTHIADFNKRKSYPFFISETSLNWITKEGKLPFNVMKTKNQSHKEIMNIFGILLSNLQIEGFNKYNKYHILRTKGYFFLKKIHNKYLSLQKEYTKTFK